MILAKPNDPLLPSSGVDLIFTSNTYHHIDNRVSYLTNLRKYLRPNGRIAIIEFDRRGWLDVWQHYTPSEFIKRDGAGRVQIAKRVQLSGPAIFPDFCAQSAEARGRRPRRPTEADNRHRSLRFFSCGRLWRVVACLRLPNQTEGVKDLREPLVLLGRRRVVKRHHGEVNGVVLVEREGMNSSHNDGFPFFISLSVAI